MPDGSGLSWRTPSFVTRAKSNMDCRWAAARPVDRATELRADQTVYLEGAQAALDYPGPLRRVSYSDEETQKHWVFPTHNFTLPALTMAQLYTCRWPIELFFKWIKQNLRISPPMAVVWFMKQLEDKLLAGIRQLDRGEGIPGDVAAKQLRERAEARRKRHG